MFTSYGSGEYATGEKHVALAARKYQPGSGKRAAIYLHGRDGTALEALDATYGRTAKALAEQGYLVLSIDAGGTRAWGNTTSRTRLADAITWARSGRFGAHATKPPLLVGTSMGALTALAYARANPTLVGGVISLVGALDLDWTHDTNALGFAAEIETAYGGASAYEAALATSDPSDYAGQLAAVPALVVYSTDDTITPAASVSAFAAAAGATTLSLGAVGHTLTGYDPAAAVAFALARVPA